MRQIVITRGLEVLVRCQNPRCGTARSPIVVIAGRRLKFLGDHGYEPGPDGKPLIKGCCPRCKAAYRFPDPELGSPGPEELVSKAMEAIFSQVLQKGEQN